MGKIRITNINKFISFIIILVLIIVFILIAIFASNSKNITSSTDISSLNSSKFSEKILEEYEKSGKKDEFIANYNDVQNAIGLYIIDNSTIDDNSFENILEDINKKISNNEWEYFNITRPTSWNGKWSVDSNGIVKFKFDRKDIEPSWSVDEDVNQKIILN